MTALHGHLCPVYFPDPSALLPLPGLACLPALVSRQVAWNLCTPFLPGLFNPAHPTCLLSRLAYCLVFTAKESFPAWQAQLFPGTSICRA